MREVYKQGKTLSSHAAFAKRQLAATKTTAPTQLNTPPKPRGPRAPPVPRHPRLNPHPRITHNPQQPLLPQGPNSDSLVHHVFTHLETEALRILDVCATILYPDIDQFCAIGTSSTRATDALPGVYPSLPASDDDTDIENTENISEEPVAADPMTTSQMYSATVDTVAERMLADLTPSTMLMMMTMLNHGPGVGVLVGSVSEDASAVVPQESNFVDTSVIEQPSYSNEMVDVPIVLSQDVESEDSVHDDDYEVIPSFTENHHIDSDESMDEDWEHI
ncbi:hypothetical protein HDU79_005997 [Rhizoclosmatium sp. JEL0117]|nr:hypothetical protein HDU79_005997 [Rhizoclosmatium sp. JEL0117]